MTGSEIINRVLLDVGETNTTSPVTYSRIEALQSINEAQRIFVLLSLCLEAQGTLSTTASQLYYYVSDQLPFFLRPLRLLTPEGRKIRPMSLGDLESRSRTWRTVTGEPTRYANLGWDLMAITPVPDATYALSLKYAKMPATLTEAGTPEIPAEDHEALYQGAIPILRLKEGGQLLSKEMWRFESFLDVARRRATYVRARSRDNQYDSIPPEWKTPDLSRLLKTKSEVKGIG